VDGGERVQVNSFNIWSFDHSRDLMQIVEGRWPEYEPPHTPEEIQAAMFEVPPIEVAIPAQAAGLTGLRVGNRVFGEGDYKFDIVGVFEPLDPQAEVWWWETSLFNLVVIPGRDEDTLILPLMVNPFAMPNVLTWRTITWRVIIDQTQITPDNAETIENKLQRLSSLTSSSGTQLVSSLPGILLAYRESLATLRMVLLLLGAQAFLFVLYALALVTGAGMETLQSEMAVLAGRGASTAQILSTYLLEGLLLALLAGGFLGPLLAQGFLFGWGRLAGVSVPLDCRRRPACWP
jgi:hypothetical protein